MGSILLIFSWRIWNLHRFQWRYVDSYIQLPNVLPFQQLWYGLLSYLVFIKIPLIFNFAILPRACDLSIFPYCHVAVLLSSYMAHIWVLCYQHTFFFLPCCSLKWQESVASMKGKSVTSTRWSWTWLMISVTCTISLMAWST